MKVIKAENALVDSVLFRVKKPIDQMGYEDFQKNDHFTEWLPTKMISYDCVSVEDFDFTDDEVELVHVMQLPKSKRVSAYLQDLMGDIIPC
jgi:hypothetical protein